MIDEYIVLSSAVAATFIAGIVKVLLETIKGSFSWKYINTYGGMPSVHTAIMTGMTTSIGIVDGVASTAFAVSIVLTIIIIRDAIGFRMYIGQNAKAINRLIEQLPDDERKKYPVYEEHVGHTPAQVIVGAIIGIITALVVTAIV